MRRLEGRIALVTGAASGIGRATAQLLAEEGAHVYLADVNGAGAEAAVAEMAAAGLAATPVTADVSLGQDVTAMFRAAEKGHGRLDVLVNNAGLNVRGDFRHLSDADWVKIREVNLDGVVRVARDGFALLKASGRGSLINVASIMAHRGLRQLTAYSATKGAVTALSRGLAVEYAPFGINVLSHIAPLILLKNPAIEKALVESTALRRLGRPEEVARAALFLAGDEASYVTGAELAVDGGMSAAL